MLKSVKIDRYKSCQHVVLPLGQRIVALAGKNGAGKTTVLHAIMLLARTVSEQQIPAARLAQTLPDDSERLRITADVEIENEVYRYSCTYPPSYSSHLNLPGVYLEEDLLRMDQSSSQPVVSRKGGDVRIEGRANTVRIGSLTPVIGALTSLLPPEDSLQPILGRLRAFFGRIQYYLFPEGSPHNADYIDEKEYNEWLTRYRAIDELPRRIAFRLLYMSQHEKQLLQEFKAIAGPEGLDLLDDFFITDLRVPEFASMSKEPSEGEQVVFLPVFTPSATMGGAGKQLHYSQLSAGTRRAVCLIATLLFDRRSVMLVEQPEDSIHPGMLRKLIDTMRSYSDQVQFIFSTHSSEVLDMLNPEEVLLVGAIDGWTSVRELAGRELVSAKEFLRNTGSLSEYLDTVVTD